MSYMIESRLIPPDKCRMEAAVSQVFFFFLVRDVRIGY